MDVISWLLKKLPGSYVTQKYGMRIHPYTKEYKMHTGTDIGGIPKGTLLPSVTTGTILGFGYTSAWGNWVAVLSEDKNYVFFYAHLDRQLRKTGEAVKQGDPIGVVGTTGTSTGIHLHFEVRKADGTPNGGAAWGDPQTFEIEEDTVMDKTPVRIEGLPVQYEAYVFKSADGTFKTFVELREFVKGMGGTMTHLGTAQGNVVFKPAAVVKQDEELLFKVQKFTSSLNDLLKL